MFLQTNLQNRRQFLERSMWGFGGLLVSSSLLQSCIKDHIIPDPTSSILPPLGETDPNGGTVNWNEDLKILVVSGVSMIPEVGEILGPLVDILWSSSNSKWDEIKGQVEALVNQKIADSVNQQVTEDLEGLNNSLTLYFNEVKFGTPATILQQWMITRNLFVNARPHFQSEGYQLLLLPTFVQFTNLYLSLLRDGAIDGQSWGMNDGDYQQLKKDLTDAIWSSAGYATQTYDTGLYKLPGAFYANNPYIRQLTLTVLEFVDTWPSFDISQYPNGNTVAFNREIYTDCYGAPTKDFSIPTPVPTQRPTLLNVWSGDRVDAVQLTYPAGSGPAGVTQTVRMGDTNGGTGHSIPINTNNAITGARAVAGDGVGSVQFAFNDGTTTDVLGQAKGVNTYYKDSGWQAYPYRALYSIYVDGVYKNSTTTDNDLSASSIVFGFKIWITQTATLSAISAMYVYSPKELSMAKVAKAYPSLALSDASISSELKAARKAYWDAMKARAEKLK